jgi:hypothetical protein
MMGASHGPWRLFALIFALLFLAGTAWWRWAAPETVACRTAKNLIYKELLAKAQQRYLEALQDDVSSDCARKGLRDLAGYRCVVAERLQELGFEESAKDSFRALGKDLAETSIIYGYGPPESLYKGCIDGIRDALKPPQSKKPAGKGGSLPHTP